MNADGMALYPLMWPTERAAPGVPQVCVGYVHPSHADAIAEFARFQVDIVQDDDDG